MDPIDNDSEDGIELPPSEALSKEDERKRRNRVRMRNNRQDEDYKKKERERRQERRAKAKRDSNRLQPDADMPQIVDAESSTPQSAAQSIHVDLPGPEAEAIKGEIFLTVLAPLIGLCIIICGCFLMKFDEY